MVSVFLLLAAMLAAPEDQARVGMEMKIFPQSPTLGDVVIINITAVNAGSAAVSLPSRFHPALGYLTVLVGQTNVPYLYQWTGHGAASGKIEVSSLAPGEQRVVAFEAIELPPVADIRHDFWTALAGSGELVQIEARLSHPQAGQFRSYRSMNGLLPRPEAEVDALLKVYTSEQPADVSDIWHAPTPGVFGLVSFPTYMATPTQLAELEASLSEGILRDVLRATRLMQTIAITSDQLHGDDGSRRNSAKELLALLSTSDELQQEWLAKNIFSWFYYYQSSPDEITQEFVQQVAELLPRAKTAELIGYAPGKLQFWPRLKHVKQGEDGEEPAPGPKTGRGGSDGIHGIPGTTGSDHPHSLTWERIR